MDGMGNHVVKEGKKVDNLLWLINVCDFKRCPLDF